MQRSRTHPASAIPTVATVGRPPHPGAAVAPAPAQLRAKFQRFADSAEVAAVVEVLAKVAQDAAGVAAMLVLRDEAGVAAAAVAAVVAVEEVAAVSELVYSL